MSEKQKVLEYLLECGVFYLGTVSGSRPKVRPMAEVCLFDNELYFAVDKQSSLYLELLQNNRISIAARHPDHSWISISGKLEVDDNRDCRQAMIEAHQESLGSMFDPDDGRLAVEVLRDGAASITRIDGTKIDFTLHE